MVSIYQSINLSKPSMVSCGHKNGVYLSIDLSIYLSLRCCGILRRVYLVVLEKGIFIANFGKGTYFGYLFSGQG